jgi:hypothetical protein
MNARRQYLEELGKEYSRANEGSRGRLLDEAEKRSVRRKSLSMQGKSTISAVYAEFHVNLWIKK